MSTKSNFSFKEFFSFIFSKAFLKHIALIIVFFIVIIVGLLWWLNHYTNHGQKLILPDYRNMNIEKAAKDAKDNKFEIIVDDSTHIVGKNGGIIIRQNPKPNSKVKENRKIYVTVTKFNPDKIKIEDLPSLYGRNFNSKKRELLSMEIKSSIKGYEYDKGSPDYILKAYYKGELIVSKEDLTKKTKGMEIEKGGTIDFVLSRRSGGSTNLPNLRCKTSEQAAFLLESRNLKLGVIKKDGKLTTQSGGYVISQFPKAIDNLPMGTVVDLEISDDLPVDCK